MALNCKQGDLAIVVHSMCGNEGKIVRCLKLLPAGHGRAHPKLGPLWEVDVELNRVLVSGAKGSPARMVPDSALRPIRPLDELDDVKKDEEVTA